MSGMTVGAFAREKHLTPSWARKKFKEMENAVSPKKEEPVPATIPELVPVTILPTKDEKPMLSSPIVLQVGKATLTIEENFNPDFLRKLLLVVRESC